CRQPSSTAERQASAARRCRRMDQDLGETAPVAIWARTLAWIIVITSAFALIGGAFGLLIRGRPVHAARFEIVPFIFSAIWILLFFRKVRITGTPQKGCLGVGTDLARQMSKRAPS